MSFRWISNKNANVKILQLEDASYKNGELFHINLRPTKGVGWLPPPLRIFPVAPKYKPMQSKASRNC